jgi:hypothetical protein
MTDAATEICSSADLDIEHWVVIGQLSELTQ